MSTISTIRIAFITGERACTLGATAACGAACGVSATGAGAFAIICKGNDFSNAAPKVNLPGWGIVTVVNETPIV